MDKTDARIAAGALAVATIGLSAGLTYMRMPPSMIGGRFIGESVGGALPIAGLPLLWWAVLRFQAKRAKGPLYAWAALLVVVGGLMLLGARA